MLLSSFESYKETIPFFSPPLGMTFRHMLYPAYKSNRTPTPDTVVQGMQYLKASIKAMSIKVIEVKIYQLWICYNLGSYLLFISMFGEHAMSHVPRSCISVKWDSCWYLALSIIDSGSRRWSWWCYWHPGCKQCFGWLQGKHWSHWSLSVVLSINCSSLIIPRMFYSNLRSWKDLTRKSTTNWITHPQMRHHIHPQNTTGI